jgi:hypothetical protein
MKGDEQRGRIKEYKGQERGPTALEDKIRV